MEGRRHAFPRKALAALAALLVALVWYADTVPAKRAARPIDERTTIAAALAAIRGALPDGESARFRHARVSVLGSTLVVCGEMTVRGAAGGYGDFVRFVWGDTIRMIERSPSSAYADDAWASHCGPEPARR
jgi:hypothetical protein